MVDIAFLMLWPPCWNLTQYTAQSGDRETSILIRLLNSRPSTVHDCTFSIVIFPALWQGCKGTHIDTIVAKASLRSKLILRCFQYRDSGLLMHAFIIFVRSILEYCSVVWSPASKKDIVMIEAVQSRFTKRLSGFSKFPYEERLASLNCESLYSRRVKCDLVMCYQMLTGSVNIDTNAFFTRSYLNTTRGNSMKLFKRTRW